MGWQDRDYHQEPGAGFGERLRLPPVTLALMVAHGAGFLVAFMLHADEGADLAARLTLSGTQRDWIGILFHPFAIGPHPGFAFLAVLFTLYILWKFVAPIERFKGGAAVLAAWLVGNLAAGAVYWLAASVPVLATRPLIGPSGAMAAWLLIAWRMYAHETVFLFGRYVSFGRVLLWGGALLVGVLLLLAGIVGGLAWLAALLTGGAAGAAGQWLPDLLKGLERPENEVAPPPRQRRDNQRRERDEAELDAVLAKISREGLDALSARERDLLERARRERQG